MDQRKHYILDKFGKFEIIQYEEAIPKIQEQVSECRFVNILFFAGRGNSGFKRGSIKLMVDENGIVKNILNHQIYDLCNLDDPKRILLLFC